MGGFGAARWVLGVVAAAGLGAPLPAVAQAPLSTLDARREGMAILQRGLDAMGGLQRLEALHSVRLRAEVTQHQVGQAPTPGTRVVKGRGDRFQHDLRNNTIHEIPEGLGLRAPSGQPGGADR